MKPNTSGKKDRNFDVLQHFGNLSPWQSVKSFGLPNASPVIPTGCDLTQVHLVHRHGARYPTSDAAPATFAAQLHLAATTTGFSASGPLRFLNTWTYRLGGEILTPFGRSQLYALYIPISWHTYGYWQVQPGCWFPHQIWHAVNLSLRAPGADQYCIGELLKGFKDLPVFRTTSQGLFTYDTNAFPLTGSVFIGRMVDSA